MSLILDALKKSERARQQTLAGRVGTVDAPGRGRLPVPWATLIGLLLVLNAASLAVIFWRSHTQAAPQAPPAPTRAARGPYRPVVRPLAEEAAAAQAASAPRLTAREPAAPTIAAKTAAPAPQTPILPSAEPAETASTPESAPALDTLPLAFQQSLPPLHLDVHSYTRKPAGRFVVINMRQYRIGDTLKEGPRILNITPQGVILEYQGQSFLLPRP